MKIAILTSCYDIGLAFGSIGLSPIAQEIGFESLYQVTALILIFGLIFYIITRIRISNNYEI